MGESGDQWSVLEAGCRHGGLTPGREHEETEFGQAAGPSSKEGSQACDRDKIMENPRPRCIDNEKSIDQQQVDLGCYSARVREEVLSP